MPRSKRQLNGQRCRQKMAYSTEIAARMGAQATLANNTPKPLLWVYRCPVCGWWHVTSNGAGDAAPAPISRFELYAPTPPARPEPKASKAARPGTAGRSRRRSPPARAEPRRRGFGRRRRPERRVPQ